MKEAKKFANRILYSDIDPFEVVRVISENKLEIRQMDAVETKASIEARSNSFKAGGFIGNYDNSLQEWDITSNENKPVIAIRKHKDGYWYTPGGSRFILSDKPNKFYDFNF